MDTDEENPLDLYVAGVVDAKGDFKVDVTKAKRNKLGYRLTPIFVLNTNRPRLVQFLDDWFIERGIFAQIDERDGSSYRVAIRRQEHLERFIYVLSPHIFATAEDARTLVNDVIPRLDEAKEDKQTFVEIVEVVEQLDSFEQSRKYTSDFFRSEWNL